eukprot:gene4443-2975_t
MGAGPASAAVLLSAWRADGGCTVAKPACYVDKKSRVLEPTDVNEGRPALSLEYCAQLCADRKKAIAGTECGIQCFCGDALSAGAAAAPDGDCHTPCGAPHCTAGDPHDSSEKCGGYFRISAK